MPVLLVLDRAHPTAPASDQHQRHTHTHTHPWRHTWLLVWLVHTPNGSICVWWGGSLMSLVSCRAKGMALVSTVHRRREAATPPPTTGAMGCAAGCTLPQVNACMCQRAGVAGGVCLWCWLLMVLNACTPSETSTRGTHTLMWLHLVALLVSISIPWSHL